MRNTINPHVTWESSDYGSNVVEELSFLLGHFFVGEDALPVELGEQVELFSWAGLILQLQRPRLTQPVDQGLHALGIGYVAVPALTLFTGGFDQQVAGVEDALDHVLGKGDVVDHLERYLFALSGNEPAPDNEPFVGDDIVGEPPLDPPRQGSDQPKEDDATHRKPDPRSLDLDGDHNDGSHTEGGDESGQDDRHPMGAKGCGGLLFSAEQTGWVLHTPMLTETA